MTTSAMTDAPIRIRARMQQGFTEVQLLMPHPMETGLRLNEAGQLLPPHHITDVTVTLESRIVFSARMSIAVSRDPLLGFRLSRVATGQRLRVSWTDNLGFSRSDETVIA